MNILQISTADIRGGAAKVAHDLKEGLEKLGHQTSMFVGQKDTKNKNVFILNDIKSFGQKVRRKLSYYLANDIDLFSSDKILKTEQFKKADIIHCHNLHGNYFNLNTLKKISRLKPIIWTFHDMWPITAHCAYAFEGNVKNGFFQCPSLDIPPAIKWHNEKYLENTKRKIYQNSNFYIVVPSLWLKQKVEKSILSDHQIILIYNGIDTENFHPYPKDKSRMELGLPTNKKVILSVIKRTGSSTRKGLDYEKQIIEKRQDKKDSVFACVGGSNYAFPNVINLPYIKDVEELAKYYSAADVLLYPSLADNCPLTVIEAQACGLPVVSFETGGIPELVEHKKTGYIAGYKDIKGLSAGLDYLLELPTEEIEKMRQQSVNKIKNTFTLKKMVDSYMDLYENILQDTKTQNL